MKCKLVFLVFFSVVFCVDSPASAQLWSGILASSRATDWTQAGATGGIQTRTTVCATLNPGATAAQINSAIASCSAGGVVVLNAGTYDLSNSIVINRSNVTLRGQGMSTVLNFTSCGRFYWGASCLYAQSSSFDSSGYGSAPGVGGVPASTKISWVGTNGQAGVYSQGATVLNLASTPTGLSPGMTITLWQSDEPDGNLPNSGYFVSDKTGSSQAISWQGSSDSADSGVQQRARVIAVNGTAVTIAAPGLHRPTRTWTTARGPMIGWQPGQLTGVGLENFRVTRSATGIQHLIAFNNTHDSWVQGVGISGGTSIDVALSLIENRNVTVRQNWWGPLSGGGVFTTTSYGISLVHCSNCLIENNIFQSVESPIMLNMGTTGSVVSYNYEAYTSGEGGLQTHQEGPALNLYESNSVTKFWADFFHGNTNLNTLFRGHFFGGQGLDLASYHRWYNAVGNVIVSAIYESRCNVPPLYDRWSGVAFRLGYPQQNADCTTTSGVAYDTGVYSSLMRWGNYVTGSATTSWLASEVPSADPLFPNPVPSTQALPPSFYYSSKPSWWPTAKAWPPIGPDVTGGNISGVVGHAYTLPAQDCYTAAGGSVANFNPGVCYTQTAGTPPSSPSSLVLQ
jgi:hypothetical protein